MQSPCHLVYPTPDTSPGHISPPSITLTFCSIEPRIQLTNSTTSTNIVISTPALTLLIKSIKNLILTTSHTYIVDHVHSIHTDTCTMGDMIE